MTKPRNAVECRTPREVKAEAARMVDAALKNGERMKRWGTLDGFCLCADYCFNDNPSCRPRCSTNLSRPT